MIVGVDFSEHEEIVVTIGRINNHVIEIIESCKLVDFNYEKYNGEKITFLGSVNDFKKIKIAGG